MQLQIFVGHGFKPCRKAFSVNPALAAGLPEIELLHRLYGLSTRFSGGAGIFCPARFLRAPAHMPLWFLGQHGCRRIVLRGGT